METEDSKELSIADHVNSMLKSDGWKYAKDKLDLKILDLQNINNIDETKPETLGIQLAARKMAVELIWAWLKLDVYGFVEQQSINQAPKEEVVESYIGREN